MFVQTIQERLEPAALGVTYIHEHLWCNPPAWLRDRDPDLVLQDLHASAREVENFLAAGGRSLVDMTALDYGRDIHAQLQIAAMTGLTLIVTTGFNKGLFFPAWVEHTGEREIAGWMIAELTEGIQGTRAKAGLIKVGAGYNKVSEAEKKVMRAAAIACRETGAPVAAHTEAGTMSLELLEYMKNLGVNPEQVIIAHADRNIDHWLMKKIASRGAYVEFDGPSKIKYYPDQARVEAIMQLIEAGFAGNIVVSGDMARRSYLQAYGGGPGLTYIIDTFIPRLKEEFAAQDIEPALADSFIRENSQRALTWR